MKLVEHYIMRGTRRLVLIIVGFLIFIFASYSHSELSDRSGKWDISS